MIKYDQSRYLEEGRERKMGGEREEMRKAPETNKEPRSAATVLANQISLYLATPTHDYVL